MLFHVLPPASRRTPLYAQHVEAGGRIVDFAGWELPVQYRSILEETRAVRAACGMFDISHMGRIRVEGPTAEATLQALTSNNVANLEPGHGQYSLLTNPHGGIQDDIIVYREVGGYLVVVNASNHDRDLAWFKKHALPGTAVNDRSGATAMIAVQGPGAPEVVRSVCSEASMVPEARFGCGPAEIAGCVATMCRTGYTGEDGFEIIVPARSAPAVWNALATAGALPAGLGARDTLRVEAGYPLYGHEIDDSTSPVEAALMWAVDLKKGPFTGSDSIQQMVDRGPLRKLVGLISSERSAPRQGYAILCGEERVGEVTSGAFSPTCESGIAMGYVSIAIVKKRTDVYIDIRGRKCPAAIVPKKMIRECGRKRQTL